MMDLVLILGFIIAASISGIIITEVFRWGYNKEKKNKQI